MKEDLECVIDDKNTVSVLKTCRKTSIHIDKYNKGKGVEVVVDKYCASEEVTDGKIEMNNASEGNMAPSIKFGAIGREPDRSRRRHFSPAKWRERPRERQNVTKQSKEDLRRKASTYNSTSCSFSDHDNFSPSSKSCVTDEDDNRYSDESDDDGYDDTTDEAYDSDRTPDRRDYHRNSDTDNCSTSSSRDQSYTDCSNDRSSYTSADITNYTDEQSESQTDTDNYYSDDYSGLETGSDIISCTKNSFVLASSEEKIPGHNISLSSVLLDYDKYSSPSKPNAFEQLSAHIGNMEITSPKNYSLNKSLNNPTQDREKDLDLDEEDYKENLVVSAPLDKPDRQNGKSGKKAKGAHSTEMSPCLTVERVPLKGKQQSITTDSEITNKLRDLLPKGKNPSEPRPVGSHSKMKHKTSDDTGQPLGCSSKRKDPQCLIAQNDSNATPVIKNMYQRSLRSSESIETAALREMPSILEKKKSLRKTFMKKQQQQQHQVVILDPTKCTPSEDSSYILSHQKNVGNGRKIKWVRPLKKFVGGLVS
jgi:hypothetical protein